MKPIIHSSWGFSLDHDFDKQVEIWIDAILPLPNKNYNNINVFIAMEPDAISHLNNWLTYHHDKFDHILTFDESLLKKCPNAILFEFGTTWIRDYVFPEKKFSTSFVCGNKQISSGHTLRHRVWYAQDKIKTPTDFYLSQHGGPENYKNNKILGESKFPLFESMFHICIENVKLDYYFSEKLIDCFLTKTIPIYYGCPSIGNYFDINGITMVDHTSEIIKACNSLTEESYINKLDSIEKNYELAQKYIEYDDRLIEKLKELTK